MLVAFLMFMSVEEVVFILPDYQLVVLCSREQENRSRLVTSLETSRVEAPVIFPLEDIKRYIQDKLTVSQDVDHQGKQLSTDVAPER